MSAQDVERVLLEHESIGEIAIIGVEDLTYGQKVAAVVSWTEGAPEVELNDIREWAKDKLPSYSLPTLLKVSLVGHLVPTRPRQMLPPPPPLPNGRKYIFM